MSTSTTTTGPLPNSVLPPKAARDRVGTCLAELVDAIQAHPQFQPPAPHSTLFHTWDFAMRTSYILSELDNVEAGRQVAKPDQIPDYPASCHGKPSREKAEEFMIDVVTRSITLDQMVNSANRIMMLMMGLQDMDFGEQVKAKAKALVESLEGLNLPMKD